MRKQKLSTMDKMDMEIILNRAMEQCECTIATHDHGIDRCPHPIGAGRKFTFKEAYYPSYSPNSMTAMVVCPTCYSLIQSERSVVR